MHANHYQVPPVPGKATENVQQMETKWEVAVCLQTSAHRQPNRKASSTRSLWTEASVGTHIHIIAQTPRGNCIFLHIPISLKNGLAFTLTLGILTLPLYLLVSFSSGYVLLHQFQICLPDAWKWKWKTETLLKTVNIYLAKTIVPCSVQVVETIILSLRLCRWQ